MVGARSNTVNQSSDIKRHGGRNRRARVIRIAQGLAFASDGDYGWSCVAGHRDDKNYVFADLDTENISQAAMNIAAITGPITKPLRPKVAMPPRVEISTT